MSKKKENKQLKMNLEQGKEGLDGILEETTVTDTTQALSFAERVAKTAHEVNRVYCEGHKDFSQVPWDEAPDWVKNSAMMGVKFFHDNPTARPKDMHDSWMAQKIEDGWKYGEVKDPLKKTHPCLVGYKELPEQQRVKDLLFLSVVKSFVSA